MEDADTNMLKATEELDIAIKYQQKGMKTNCGCTCILIAIIVFLCWGFFSSKSNVEKPDWLREEEARRAQVTKEQEKEQAAPPTQEASGVMTYRNFDEGPSLFLQELN